MTNAKSGNADQAGSLRLKLGNFLAYDPYMSDSNQGGAYDCAGRRDSSASAASPRGNYEDSAESSPYAMSPWHHPSPYAKSPWSMQLNSLPHHGLVWSLVREEGHVYSLAADGDLLYTGSDSKNIRVWKDLEEHSGFKSSSGLVKDIVVHGGRVFTGHQDGKIRVWKARTHRRVGTLPRFKDMVKKSMNPKNYVEVRRHRNKLRIRHYDAVSCLTLSEEQGLLYSGSWDKTVKCWRISDSKCLESIAAHDDAVNAVACGFEGLVFTGSADGKVKVWRREGARHFLVQVLLEQETAVTSLSVNKSAAVVYCGSSDGLVNYWEREKRMSHGGVLRGHKQAVLCLATAGTLLFSGSADKTICVWRRDATGAHTCLSVLTGHAGPVKCLALKEDPNPSHNRWILYSGSLDKSVKVWRVSDTVPKWQQVKAAVDLDADA